jgi:hypothetical protein
VGSRNAEAVWRVSGLVEIDMEESSGGEEGRREA